MKLCRIFNIDVKIHWTTSVLIFTIFSSAFSYVQSIQPNASLLSSLLATFLIIVGLLLSVLLHEFGHILVGRKYGINFKEVMLHVFGGAAVMESKIPNPKAELFMALAGPLVSLFLSFILVFAAIPFALFDTTIPVAVLGILAQINLSLFIFNLCLCAFPLDGGRILRALLWYKFGYKKATVVSTHVGKCLGWALAGCGVSIMLGVNVIFFGTGIGSGVWILMMGLMLNLAASLELEKVKNEYNC